MKQFDPEVNLDHTDRAYLVAIASMDGYKVLNRLMRAEVDKFIVAQINADPADEAAVLAAHRMAKAAAQFYTGLTNRVNEEIVQYTNAPRDTDKPVDATEGLIDLGEAAAEFSNIFRGEGFYE